MIKVNHCKIQIADQTFDGFMATEGGNYYLSKAQVLEATDNFQFSPEEQRQRSINLNPKLGMLDNEDTVELLSRSQVQYYWIAVSFKLQKVDSKLSELVIAICIENLDTKIERALGFIPASDILKAKAYHKLWGHKSLE